MFFRCHIAQHGRAVPADLRRTDGRGNVIIARRNVGGQRPQRVEGRFVAPVQLLVHIFLDELHRHMAGPFDHHLHIVFPGDLGQLAQCLQLAQLGFVIGIPNRAGAQAVTQ